MNNRLFIVMVALLTAACHHDLSFDDSSICEGEFIAMTESYSDSTRTSLDSDGNVLWEAGDQVSIFYASTINQQYQVSDASAGKTSASLNLVSGGSGGGFYAGGELPDNVAYYPYSSSTEIRKSGSGYSLSVNLPVTQAYAANTFGRGAFPMTAVTSGTNDFGLKFKNVLGGVKLQLTGDASVRRIEFEGNNGEVLCGPATISVSNSSMPLVSMSDKGSAKVTLDCGNDGVQLNESTPTDFIIALPPMTLTKGFTAVIWDTQGRRYSLLTTRSQVISRSTLLRMPVQNISDFASPLFALVYENADIQLRTFKYKADRVYLSSDVKIVESSDPNNVIYSYDNGKMLASDYAKSEYGFADQDCTLDFKPGSALTYPYPDDAESTFGGCLTYGRDRNGLFLAWDNMETSLLKDKYADYNIVLNVGGVNYELKGKITVLSTYNSTSDSERLTPEMLTIQSDNMDIELGTFKDEAFRAYVPMNFQIVEKETPRAVVYTYADGVMKATSYAQSTHGLGDKVCTVSFKSGSELTYPYPNNTKASFGGCLTYGIDQKGLFLEWDNLGTDLLVDKYADYNLVINVSDLFSCEVTGKVTVLSTANTKAKYPFSQYQYSSLFKLVNDNPEVTLCTFKNVADTVHLSSDFKIVEISNPNNVIYSYGDGKMLASDYAKAEYGFVDQECVVSFKSGSELTYPYPNNTKASFGGCLTYGSNKDGLFLAWDNLGTDLLINKYADYNLAIIVGDSYLYESTGKVTVLSTANTKAQYPSGSRNP